MYGERVTLLVPPGRDTGRPELPLTQRARAGALFGRMSAAMNRNGVVSRERERGHERRGRGRPHHGGARAHRRRAGGGRRRPRRRPRPRLRRRRAQHTRRPDGPAAQSAPAPRHQALQPQARPASGDPARPGRRRLHARTRSGGAGLLHHRPVRRRHRRTRPGRHRADRQQQGHPGRGPAPARRRTHPAPAGRARRPRTVHPGPALGHQPGPGRPPRAPTAAARRAPSCCPTRRR